MASWTLDDIPWTDFDAAKVNAEVLKVVKAAAMVERNGADYGRYLANVFADDPDFAAAAAEWAAEEERHGLALGRWAELADPAFDFDGSFARFRSMYAIPVDASQSVRGSRSGELCARCVVESGTSSFYSALRDGIEEPVLRAICKNIAADEFRHYKLFYSTMERYLTREPLSIGGRLKVVLTRFKEADDDELASAYYSGNDLKGPYDRASAAAAYSARAFGFYRERHTRRAAFMMARAAGLDPEGWFARTLARTLWWVIGFKGRAFRAEAAAT